MAEYDKTPCNCAPSYGTSQVFFESQTSAVLHPSRPQSRPSDSIFFSLTRHIDDEILNKAGGASWRASALSVAKVDVTGIAGIFSDSGGIAKCGIDDEDEHAASKECTRDSGKSDKQDDEADHG